MTDTNETPNETLEFTLSSAAKELGKSKATISRAIHSGKLSAVKNESGGYKIQASELFRVYPRNETKRPQKNEKQPTSGTHETPIENIELRAELKAIKETQEIYKERIEELKKERDEWREQSKLLALTNQNRQKEPETPRKLFKWF